MVARASRAHVPPTSGGGATMKRVLAATVAAAMATGVAADSGETMMIVSLSLLGVVLIFALILCILLYRSRAKVVQFQHKVNFLEAPGIPMVRSVTGETLELHWAPPASAEPGMIVHYNIKFNIGDNNYYFDTRTPLPQFTITGLKPGSRVDHIRVCPVYFGGEDEGSYSPHVYAMTNDYPGAPRGLRSTSDSQNSITLAWNHPEFDGRTPVRQYAVTYSYGGVPRSFATNDDVPRCTVQDLPAGAKLLDVMVAAINDVGQGPPCPPLAVAETHVSGAAELHITAVTNTAVQLHWVPPAGKDVLGYVVRWRAGGEQKEAQVGAEPQYLIAGLAPGSSITNVNVAPITAEGEGQSSNTLPEVQTMGTCGPPQAVHVVSATDSTLTLAWTAPHLEPASDPITYYTVAFDVGGDIRQVSTPNAEPRVTLKGLPAASHVESITVRGVVAGVAGEPSAAASGKTLIYDAPPEHLRVSSVHTDRVQLMWDPPQEPTRSYVSSYVVSYTLRGKLHQINTNSNGTSFELGGGGGDPVSSPLADGSALTEVSVHAVTNKGATAPSNTIAVRTLGKPAQVSGLRKSAEQPNGMTLHWAPPDAGGSPLQKYMVSYTVDGEEVRTAVAPNATSFVLRGLPPQSSVPEVAVSAVNRVGQGPAATIRGRERPGACKNLKVARATGETVTLVWQPPEDDGGTAITHYNVRYSVPTSGAAPVTVRTEGNQPTFVIGQDGGTQPLPPGSIVEGVQVTAVNLAGESTDRGTVLANATTLSRCGPPQRLILGDPGDGRVLPLRWEPPVETGGAPITTYRVFYSVDGKEQEVDTGSSKSNFDLPGPGPGHSVTNIRVCPVTVVGPGGSSNPVAMDVVPAPRRLEVGKVSMTTVPISWDPADDGGCPVRSYVVKYSVNDAAHSVNTGSAEPRFVIGGGQGNPPSAPLNPSSRVVFNVAAVNVAGEGPACAQQETSTAAEGAASDLQVVDFTRDSVTVSWVEPVAIANAPTKYVVSYTVNGTPMSCEVPAPASQATIGNLAPGTEIKDISVRGVSAAGPGPSSAVMPHAQTLDMPGPPQAAKVAEVTPVSVVVVWKAPLQSGGRIDYYTVTYIDAAGTEHTLRTEGTARRRLEVDHLPHGYALRHIKVSAVNEAGTGPARDAGSATTHDVPAVPEDLVIDEVTTTTITLEWDDPEHNGGLPVTSFHVQYTVDGVESNSRVDPDVYSFQIAGLLPGRSVSAISVSAENEVGIGSHTPPQSAMTTLPRPPTPDAPTLTKALRTRKMLRMRWRNPTFGRARGMAGEEVVAFELQWKSTAGFASALNAVSGGEQGGTAGMMNGDAAEHAWGLCHKVVVDANGKEHQTTSVEVLPNCSYDFRVRCKNALGVWGDCSEVCESVYLGTAHGARPERSPVRGIALSHTGGGYVASTGEIKRFIAENVAADTKHDEAMIKWLKDQGWGALRTWARRCARMSAPQRAAEAFRLMQPPEQQRRGGDERKTAEEELRGKTGKAYDRHVSPWLKRNRAVWVHIAETAAAGRPSMLKMIPGSTMYKRLSRGKSMRRHASVRSSKGGTYKHGENSIRGLRQSNHPSN